MKPQRPRPPTPRTLATPPAASPLRVPHATAYEPRFPTLAVLLASGVALPACHDPVCGSSRADELERHGPTGLRAAGDGRATDALRELGVALGVIEHGPTTVPDAQIEGRRAVVHPLPPPQPPQPPQVQPPPTTPDEIRVTGGISVPVSPQPPQVQPPAHMRTQPTPPQRPPAVRGARRPVAPTPPRPQRALEGDIISVGPLPADLTRRPA